MNGAEALRREMRQPRSGDFSVTVKMEDARRHDIPGGIWIDVCAFVGSDWKWWARAATVNKQWLLFARSPSDLRRSTYEKSINNAVLQSSRRLLCPGALQTLNFGGCGKITDAGLQHLAGLR